MYLNIEGILRLIKEKFRNNKTFFADEIGINRGYLSTVLNGNGKEDSPKLCNAIIKYCEKNNLDCEKYIFFANNVIKK